MNSILCKNTATALKCITHLRKHRYPPETFLPIDDLVAVGMIELDESRVPPDLKLLVDVISIRDDDPVVREVLEFICGNSMVCDTAELARRIAYGFLSVRTDTERSRWMEHNFR